MTIQDAINLLEDNGYAVIKYTDIMREECNKCTFSYSMGKEKNCLTCSNNICLSEYMDRNY